MLELNANSPGDSFLSVRDENERRKEKREGGREGDVWRTRQADMRESEVTEGNMGGDKRLIPPTNPTSTQILA